MLFRFFVALWFPHCFLRFFCFFFCFCFLFCFVLFFLFFVFSVCVVMLASIAARFAFCFTNCVVMLAFWSPSTAAHFAFYFTVVLRIASGPRVKLAGRKSALTPTPPPHTHTHARPHPPPATLPPPALPNPAPPVYSTDRSKAVVPVWVLLFVALWFILRGDLFYVLPCVILFLYFSVLLALRLPR